jgi:hypothetical protein
MMAPGKVRDEGLIQIAQLSGVEYLSVAWAPVTDEGMAQVARMPGLRRLHVICGSVTDEGLRSLTALRQLKELAIVSDGLTDDGLAELTKFVSLDVLHIGGSQITGRGLLQLHGWPIPCLSLQIPRLDDAAPDALKGLPNLTVLSLSGTFLSEGQVKGLAELHGLKHLCFGTVPCELRPRDDCLRHLGTRRRKGEWHIFAGRLGTLGKGM